MKTTIRAGQPLSGGPERLSVDRVGGRCLAGYINGAPACVSQVFYRFYFQYYSIAEPPVNGMEFRKGKNVSS